MTRQKKIILMGALAGVMLFGWLWLSQRAKVPDAAPKFETGAVQAPELERQSTSGGQRPVLPPLSLPLKDSLPKLRELALQGHSEAQCRLASEFQKCLGARRQLAFSESYVRRAEATESTADANGAMRMFGQSSLESDLKHCDGIEEFEASEVVVFWRRAAEAGNREAMLRYSTGAAFDMGHIVDLAQELQTYKSKAVAIARRSAAEGDGRALVALASAYSPDSHIGAPTLLAQVTGDDVVQSLGLFLFADRNGIRPADNSEDLDKFIRVRINNLRAAASADQNRLAEKLATDLAAEWRAPALPSGNEKTFLANAQYAPSDPKMCAKTPPPPTSQ